MKEFVEKLIGRLEEKFKYNSEQAEIWRNGSDTDSYFREKADLYMDRANIYGETIRIVNQLAEEYNNGWIPCSERLPENPCWTITCDEEENIHIFFYRNGYFCESYGGKPITEQNARYYVPIAWQPLPEPYKKE